MFAFLAPLLLKLSPVGSFLKAVPTKLWYALAIIAALLAAYLWHGHEVKKHDATIIAANDAQWQKKLDAEVAAVKAKDAQLRAMSVKLRKANDEENARIAGVAGTILHDGPGKAACPGLGRAPAASSGPKPSAAPGNAPVAQVPPAGGLELIALPFADTVLFGESYDELRARDQAWNEWYAQLVAHGPKSAPAKP